MTHTSFPHGWNEGDIEREHLARGWYDDGRDDDLPTEAELFADRCFFASKIDPSASLRKRAIEMGMSEADAQEALYGSLVDWLNAQGEDVPF